MATRRFSRAGLERLRNLSDIPDPDQAVTNILSGMKAAPTMPFTRRNLDPWVGLSVNGFPDQGLDKLAGAAPKLTQFDPVTNTSITTVVTPVITLRDSLDAVEAIQGDKADLGGGLGPTTKYYNLNQINVLQPAIVFTGPFQAVEQLDKSGVNSWGNGKVSWNSQLHPELNGLLGGVLYEGYLNINWLERSRIFLTTNAYFILELDQLGTSELNVLREFRSVDRTISVVSGTVDTNTCTLDAASIVKVYVGDQFTSTMQAIPAGAQITEINLETSTITLNTTLTGDINTSTSFSVTRTKPTDISAFTELLQIVPLEPALFRLQIWWSDTESLLTQKSFSIDIRGGEFTYKYLFPSDYQFDPASTLKSKYLNGIKTYGGVLGIPTSATTYRNLKTLQSITISYVPPTTLSVVTLSTLQTLRSNRLFTSTNFNVKPGFILFSDTTGFPSGCVVQYVRDGNTIIMSEPASATDDNSPVRAIPPQGFCASFKGTATSGQSVIQVATPTTVTVDWVGHLLFCDVAGVPTESVISEVDTLNNTITINQTINPSITAQRFYIYYSSGLVDLSLQAFCPSNSGSSYCTPNPTLYLPFIPTETGLQSDNVLELTTSGATIRWDRLHVTVSDLQNAPVQALTQTVTHLHEFKYNNTTSYKLLAVKLPTP